MTKANDTSFRKAPLSDGDVLPLGETRPTADNVVDLAAADPFNPAAFAAPPAQDLIAAERLLVTCKVGNPPKDAFVRAHPDPEMTMEAYVLKLESTGETYLLTPLAALTVAEAAKRVRLTVAIDRQGTEFLWLTYPVPTDGKDNSWHRSGRLALEESRKRWVSVRSNQAAKGYDVIAAVVAIPDPEWPDRKLTDYLRAGFGDNFTIRDANDPVILRLMGLA